MIRAPAIRHAGDRRPARAVVGGGEAHRLSAPRLLAQHDLQRAGQLVLAGDGHVVDLVQAALAAGRWQVVQRRDGQGLGFVQKAHRDLDLDLVLVGRLLDLIAGADALRVEHLAARTTRGPTASGDSDPAPEEDPADNEQPQQRRHAGDGQQPAAAPGPGGRRGRQCRRGGGRGGGRGRGRRGRGDRGRGGRRGRSDRGRGRGRGRSDRGRGRGRGRSDRGRARHGLATAGTEPRVRLDARGALGAGDHAGGVLVLPLAAAVVDHGLAHHDLVAALQQALLHPLTVYRHAVGAAQVNEQVAAGPSPDGDVPVGDPLVRGDDQGATRFAPDDKLPGAELEHGAEQPGSGEERTTSRGPDGVVAGGLPGDCPSLEFCIAPGLLAGLLSGQ